jgi:hypothetical protein
MYTRTNATTPIASGDDSGAVRPKLLNATRPRETVQAIQPEGPVPTPATWEAAIEWAPPGNLLNHPTWSGLLGFASSEIEEQMAASVRDDKVVQPLIVTGVDCASGQDVILDGHRRRQGALDARLPLVPVIRRTGLTAEAEEEIVLKAGLASAHTRKLKPSKLATLEHRLYEVRSRGRGFRSDLTSVGSNGGGGHDDALTAVARDAGQSRNSVAERRKVFFSPLAPKLLHDAVDSGALSLTAAASFVREAEGREAARSVLQLSETDASALKKAKADVEEEVRKLLKRPKHAKRPRPADTALATNCVSIALPKDGTPQNVKLAGKSYSVRVGEDAQSSVTLEIVPIPDRAGRHGSRKRPNSEPRPSTEDAVQTIVERDAGGRVHLAVAATDPYGRKSEHAFIENEIARGAFRPFTVLPAVSGLSRPMTVLLAERNTKLVKFAYHGDDQTFCPPIWGDVAIGSGACGFGCRTCFLMLTFRELRDPLQPVVYTNGDDFERVVARWLRANKWWVDGKGLRTRTAKDTIGLGIDCADSLLWEGVTGHARRLIPLFLNPKTNPLGNQLILLTKSANVHYLEEIAELRRFNGDIPNVAVTLNPEPIADLWEGKYPDTLERITPPIAKRLEALRWAQDMGFEVRVRVDPILTPEGWEDHYAEFFRHMVNIGLRPTMLTLGSHREKSAQLDTFRARWELPAPEWEADVTQTREGTHFHMLERGRVYQRVRELAHKAYEGTGSRPWLSLCKETHDVRRETGFCNSQCNCLKLTKDGQTQRRLPVV